MSNYVRPETDFGIVAFKRPRDPMDGHAKFARMGAYVESGPAAAPGIIQTILPLVAFGVAVWGVSMLVGAR